MPAKQGREELVAFFYVAAESAAGASHQLLLVKKKREKKKKNNNFPSVFCLPLYCSKISPSRPVTPPHPSSPVPPPSSSSLLLSSLVLTPHCTQVPAEFLQQEGTGPKKPSSVRATADCWLASSPLRSPLIDSSCFHTSLSLSLLPLCLSSLSSSLFLLRLILKAQHSLHACTEGKK